MNEISESDTLTFTPINNQRLAKLCGQFDEHLRLIEKHFDVEINSRGNVFKINGLKPAIHAAITVLRTLYDETEKHDYLDPAKIHLALQESTHNTGMDINQNTPKIRTKRTYIHPRGPNQADYIHNILNHDINFGIGPAGTGKTYLAVACAVQALEREQVSRIILVRPAIEAGERLGFLPGDLSQKVDPYLRPLYDALYDMMSFEHVTKLTAENIIEIAPLAYMRGRTLSDAFVILDEGQNATKEQMKMFLTRIGFDSVAVVTGDITQIDLPPETESGLSHCIDVLEDIDDLSFTYFDSNDVVRHPLVKKIINAYDKYQANQGRN